MPRAQTRCVACAHAKPSFVKGAGWGGGAMWLISPKARSLFLTPRRPQPLTGHHARSRLNRRQASVCIPTNFGRSRPPGFATSSTISWPIISQQSGGEHAATHAFYYRRLVLQQVRTAVLVLVVLGGLLRNVFPKPTRLVRFN